MASDNKKILIKNCSLINKKYDGLLSGYKILIENNIVLEVTNKDISTSYRQLLCTRKIHQAAFLSFTESFPTS